MPLTFTALKYATTPINRNINWSENVYCHAKIGNYLKSSLLVMSIMGTKYYFQWKLSHHRHHHYNFELLILYFKFNIHVFYYFYNPLGMYEINIFLFVRFWGLFVSTYDVIKITTCHIQLLILFSYCHYIIKIWNFKYL